MVLQGILWQIIYLGLACISSMYAVWKKHFAKYNFKFLIQLKTYTNAYQRAKGKFIEQQAKIRNMRKKNKNDNDNNNDKNIDSNNFENNDKSKNKNNKKNKKNKNNNRLQVSNMDTNNSLTDTYQAMDSNTDANANTYIGYGYDGQNNKSSLLNPNVDIRSSDASFAQIMGSIRAPHSDTYTEFSKALGKQPNSSYNYKIGKYRSGNKFASSGNLIDDNNDNGNTGNNGNDNDNDNDRQGDGMNDPVGYSNMNDPFSGKHNNNNDIDLLSVDSYDHFSKDRVRRLKRATKKLVFVLQANDSPRFRTFKFIFIPLLLIGMFICFIVGAAGDMKFVTFIGYILIIYYYIVVFRRGKWNALYYLYSGRFHQPFFNKAQLKAQFESSITVEYNPEASANFVNINFEHNNSSIDDFNDNFNDINDIDNQRTASPILIPDNEPPPTSSFTTTTTTTATTIFGKSQSQSLIGAAQQQQQQQQQQGRQKSSSPVGNDLSAISAAVAGKQKRQREESLKTKLMQNYQPQLVTGIAKDRIDNNIANVNPGELFVFGENDSVSWDVERNKFIMTQN